VRTKERITSKVESFYLFWLSPFLKGKKMRWEKKELKERKRKSPEIQHRGWGLVSISFNNDQAN